MSHVFAQRHPGYVIRKAKARKLNATRQEVEFEFEMLDTLGNRLPGHADVIFDKGPDNSWHEVQEDTR